MQNKKKKMKKKTNEPIRYLSNGSSLERKYFQ